MTISTSQQQLLDLDRPALAAWCESRGHGAYRADQIRRWIFGKRVESFEEMHDLPRPLRESLAEEFTLFQAGLVQHQGASDRTEKLLIELHDGQTVECVLMRETSRRTVCISTQVGCAMGCVFCASGLHGVKRNLATGEILEQVLRLDRRLNADERLTNVVVMGIGEPLANLKSLLPALDTLNDKGGLGLGARRITVSTVGLPEGIRRLAAHSKPYNLAISLHAPTDELRNQIVPINRGIGIEAVLQAADEYFAATGRRVTYEYVLLRGLNDDVTHARQLGSLLKGRNAHVNLIPMNPVEPLALDAPSSVQVTRFVTTLEEAGVNVTLRKRKGADIDAACGQLRLKQEEQTVVAIGS
jgi:23S rRNA (adenine2503-C2)-methyltransferase